MYSTGYTILSEVSKSHKKNLFGTIIDTMFPIGTLFLIIIAYFLSDWRHLQLAMSSFTLLLVIIIWFVPESPRWLISQNRHDEAKKIIEKYYKAINKPTLITESPTLSLRSESSDVKTKKKKEFKRYFGKSKILFSDPVLRKKLFIMYFAFFVTLSVGYCLIFNIDLFETNRYIYSSIAASIELIALLSIPVILLKLSCKKASCIIYILASICMLSIIAVPKENINVIMGMTMVAKFCLITSFTVNMLLASELFPIAVRNTAIGTGLVMSQLGSMTAPYIIDFLSQVAWWAPTTLCGISSFIAGLLCLIIPT
ncbi:organic cation transporter protein-like isoform X1 [Microplitis mediator]|uniref:organic cation transporter protein-like isoform X1 n=1 Tax=Microplitis mediator TaxID=375433 RepID=UPI00255659D9|nr:organic cation transporter protein-like isoform X1 [Microplitis mediator]